MAYRELELRLLSAQELKDVNLMTRMHVYAVVSISGDPLTRQCTAPDPYGGRNPCWNATFRFAVPPTANGACLHVLLRAERLLGDRDVGEVVVPLADILAGATGAGPQPPQLASYQVRKVHRWEPRGVLNVSYRLGPIVAPVADWVPDKAADFNNGYAPAVAVPQQASHQHPSAAAADEAAQNKSPVMAYPVGVPQQASHPPAKPDAYQPPTPPRPRTAAVHEAPAPPPRNGHGQPGPTHVYMAPQTQIIFGGAPTATTAAGLPSRATSPARSIISPAGKTGDGNWSLLHDTHGNSNYASAAESVSVISPRSRREEDRWRPSVLSQSHHDTEQQARSSPAARLGGAAAASSASPLSSRSSSFSSSPLPPYTAASPRPPAAVSGDAEVTHGTFRSTPSVSPYSSSTLAPVIPKPAISSPSLSTHP